MKSVRALQDQPDVLSNRQPVQNLHNIYKLCISKIDRIQSLLHKHSDFALHLFTSCFRPVLAQRCGVLKAASLEFGLGFYDRMPFLHLTLLLHPSLGMAPSYAMLDHIPTTPPLVE